MTTLQLNTCRCLLVLAVLATCFASGRPANAQLKTWDGEHRVDAIDVSMVYFVPKDAAALPDWKERLAYYAGRIERFHARELEGQSTLTVKVVEEPFRSALTIDELRRGDADSIFFKTLREVDSKLRFGQGARRGFPILLVLSEINWRALDDFYRVKPSADGWTFEGNYHGGRHFPGAESGGARATYLADRGVGWGLVSGDGWRVPYAGSDCVVYHEGVGHSIGLPHNEPADGAVMSLGQYNGWINQSWLDMAQKKRLGWLAPEESKWHDSLFTGFTAIPDPAVPKPNAEVTLKMTWPSGARLKTCRLRIQTDVQGPWLDIPTPMLEIRPAEMAIGKFDRPTPVSYRIDVELEDGQREELWGYFQVREEEHKFPVPTSPRFVRDTLDADVKSTDNPAAIGPTIDLLEAIDVEQNAVSGEWELNGGILTSPKAYGARIELPLQGPLPAHYELIVIAEPLDEPNGLILGQLMGNNRFMALVNYQAGENRFVSALENVDNQNFAEGPTTIEGSHLKKNRLSQIVVRVQENLIKVDCDGRNLIRWQGEAKQLSLSDYWVTPDAKRLFLGAYDCRYRFHRVTLTPIKD